ncbi:MAG: polysaccharide biosynthesis tyrosine autokinase [Muribaculum sp.]|nr:polysaccharide biosynthesis tyrosine autokinase [Muribaculum sp.]
MADLENKNTQEVQPSESSINKNLVPTVNVSDVLTRALKYWYWIVLSVIICVGIGWVIYKSTPPTYTSTASILLRDESTDPLGSASVDLEQMGLKQTKTNIEDEVQAIKSPDLMINVVLKLNLDVSYRKPGMFHDQLLYGKDVPVTVAFPDANPEEYAKIHFTVDENGNINLEEAEINGRTLVAVNGLKLGQSLATGSGVVTFTPSPFYKAGEPLDIIVERYPLKTAVAIFSNEVKVEAQTKKSSIIDLSCVDQNPTRAKDILSTIIEVYKQNWVNAKAQIVANTNQFIDERLAAVESELGSVDGTISSYKSSNLIPDVSQASSLYMQESANASNQILGLNNQLQMARYLRNYVSTEGRNQVLPVNTGLGSGNIENLIGEYNSMMMQRNSTAANSSESNPVVQEYDSRLAALRRSILSSIDNQEVSLSTSIRNLERNEQSATARVAASPRQARYLLSAERQQKVQESIYLYLLQKREENELSQAVLQVNTRVIKSPESTGVPTAPNRNQILLVAFAVGLAIPVGSIYLIQASNTKVRGRRDLEGLSIPIIGEVPRFKNSRHKSVSYFKDPTRHRDRKSIMRDIVVEEGNRDIVNEAFRVLRTNVNFITANATPVTIMLTSFNPGSGKTFTAINLGIALALKHRKVLLVDCDMRRTSLSRFVKAPHKGLATYLAGAIHDVDPVIVRNAFADGLDILPVGSIPPNPTELLETQRFQNLIEYLRSEYEYIFLDCPPVEMMADAQIVAQCADRTFFVVRVGLFERTMLSELDRLYRERKYPNMSVILNDSMTNARYGSAYRYGYGYSKKSYEYYSKTSEK